MIAFSCPHCGSPLQVRDSMAGKTGPCPKCSRVVQAPSAGSSSLPGAAGTKSGVRGSGSAPRLPNGAEDSAPPFPERSPPRDYPFLAPPRGPDEMGRLGTYLVRGVLGNGCMGVVFRAEDSQLKRPVALKVMKPTLAAFPEYHRRFLREAQLAAAIDHEHIVTIYHVGEDRGVPYLAMKLLQGETLEDRLERSPRRLPLPEVLRVGREIAEGLAAAHERGLVHRDIKPANIWLESGRDRVKIVDFGLARGGGEDGRLTQSGAVVGTPSYMAPEQANAEEVDGRSDLFSLGAVLYRAATGELPFPGKDTLSVLSALATKTPPPPHQLVPSLPRAFSDLVMRLLAKQRGKRPQSAREVVEALEAVERGEAAGSAPAPPPEEAPPARARPRAEAAPAAAPAVEAVEEELELVEDGEASASGVKRKGPRKPRPSGLRRKKPAKDDREWNRAVLAAGLVMLAVGILVLVLGIVHRVRLARDLESDVPPGVGTARGISTR